MQEVNTVIEARWVLPVIPRGQLLEHAALVISGAEIIDLLPIREARQRFRALQTYVLPDHVLIPGMINLHTHAAMALMRGLADDLPLMDWLQSHIWPAEQHVVSERFVQDGTLLAAVEMLRAGVTCFNDMYFYPEAAAGAIERVGIRASLGLVVLEFPTAYAGDADDYLHKGLAARDALRQHTRITTCFAPHAPYTISDKTFGKVLTYAEQLELNIHLHLHETRDEVVQGEAQHGCRPLQRLSTLGMLGPNLVAAHCVHLHPAEIEMLAAHGCHVAHCPASNLKLASGIAPVPALLQAGLNVGLGTDGAASNNRLDMLAEMRLAALLAKSYGDAAILPAWQALEMATINGARALGLEDKIGSLERGKAADVVAIDLSMPETQPCYDPLSQLVYAAGREQVTHTWVDGELRYARGVHQPIDQDELKEIAALWQGKLKPFHH